METAPIKKLTIKQAVLSLLLQAAYWLMAPLMGKADPRRAQIESLLNEADMLSGDYINVIQRRASSLDREDCLTVLRFMDQLADEEL